MGKIHRMIPFGVWPANWGLTGKRREEALAEYYYDGEDLARKLLDIRHDDKRSVEYALAKLRLDWEYGLIEDEAYDRAVLETKHPDPESDAYMLAELDIDLKYGHITENDKERICASIKGEPWFKIIGGEHVQNGSGATMAFELDWNDEFVRDLEKQGWTAATDDQIVNLWFEEACRQMLLMEPLEDEIDEIQPTGRTRKSRGEGGRAEYS